MLLRRAIASLAIAATTVVATAGVAGAIAPSTRTTTLESSLRCAYYHARFHLSPHDTLETSGADNEWWLKGALEGCDFVLWD